MARRGSGDGRRIGGNRAAARSVRTRKGVAALALLEVTGLSRHFGGLAAVSDLDLPLEEGRDPRSDRSERRGQEHPA